MRAWYEMVFHSKIKTVILLIVLCTSIRFIFWFSHRVPIIYPDSKDYQELSIMIGSFNFYGFNGIRTPGYPLLMLLCRSNPLAIFIFQMVIGITISIILFFIFRLLSNSNILAFIIGISHSLNLTQLLYEASILSETLTTFLITTAVFLMFYIFKYRESSHYFLIFFSGLFVSFAVLTRPICIILPAIFFLFLNAYSRKLLAGELKKHLISLIVFILPCIFIIGGWCYFNYKTTGSFSLSILPGLQLMNWSGSYIESAPSKYNKIKDIYIKYREKRGTSKDAIWGAIPELKRKTGLSLPNLSKLLEKISFLLIIQHPKEYTYAVFNSWLFFWVPPFCTKVNLFLKYSIAFIILFCEFVFLTVPIIGIISKSFRYSFRNWKIFFFVYTIIIAISIIQASTVPYSDAARYSIIVDPLTIGMALYFISIYYNLLMNFILENCN